MKINGSASVLCAAMLAAPLCLSATCFAMGVEKSQPAAASAVAFANGPLPDGSSSSSLPDAPGYDRLNGAFAMGANMNRRVGVEKIATRPFSAVALGINFGVGGVGFQVATPLAARVNLRGGASFLSVSPAITTDGINVNGTITLKTVNASVDFYPFGGSFRISPGVVLYNGNHLHANAYVPSGQTFTLNDVDYTSGPVTPISGTFDVTFGRKVAPSLTMGFGNMIPHKPGQHWSVPFEIGFEYIGTPTIALSLSGDACQGVYCMPIASDPDTQANVAEEQTDLNNDISALRFYPIATLGLSYKFGGSKAR